MEVIWQAVYYFAIALILALLEIEIEGKNGWAAKLPTWRLDSNHPLSILTGKRPTTGYWLFCNLLFFVIFHQPLISTLNSSVSWGLQQEMDVLFRWLVFLPVWDFLWFVFNPHFGLKKFRRSEVWWHQKVKWLFSCLPLDYLGAILLGLALPLLAINFGVGHIDSLTKLLANYCSHFYYLAIQIGLVILAIISAPLYHKIYRSLRKTKTNP